MDPAAIGRMSCNPAIGGTAKGHLVREIDALGGEMGKLADATGIHFKMLNKSKGPAVWSPRCQNDREWYSREAIRRVSSVRNLQIIQGTIVDILIDRGRVVAVDAGSIGKIPCRTLVVCGGTFLNAVMHTGLKCNQGGRFGERASNGLSERLTSLGFTSGRLKTGTPPRISKRSIDFGSTEEQAGDSPPSPFSFETDRIRNHQIPMYLTYTNSRTHDILRTGFNESPMFTGRIKGAGPRYCPSIEDKLCRFEERERHQLFLEPEGYDTDIVYVNGFSTSLPEAVQVEAIRSIAGLERAELIRPGYAVEYDFFPPHQLYHTLETKLIKGLFFAGQINGTSGYEEAAAQGIMAGINAALAVQGSGQTIIDRSEAYIGVLIDDLINKSTEEPYRMFTSRAEYRLKLRQDNADSRLMRIGQKVGLVSSDAIRRLQEKEDRIEKGRMLLTKTKVHPSVANGLLAAKQSAQVDEPVSLGSLLLRSELKIRDVLTIIPEEKIQEFTGVFDSAAIADRVEIETKYAGYLKRQEEQIELFKRSEVLAIPNDFDFSSLRALSSEGREKLARIRPASVGQAGRIAGVTPADVAVLMIHLRN